MIKDTAEGLGLQISKLRDGARSAMQETRDYLDR